MADNCGCAKLGHFHSYSKFPEFNTVPEIMEILREIQLHVNSIIMILEIFKV